MGLSCESDGFEDLENALFRDGAGIGTNKDAHLFGFRFAPCAPDICGTAPICAPTVIASVNEREASQAEFLPRVIIGNLIATPHLSAVL